MLGNTYITEYRSINEDLCFPVMRVPWLGSDYGFERPEKCSDEVTWAVEHYERYPGFFDEPVEDEPKPELVIDEPSLCGTAGGKWLALP